MQNSLNSLSYNLRRINYKRFDEMNDIKPIIGNNVYYLKTSDFEEGTYRIKKGGKYILTENIIFEPKGTVERVGPFILGFFSAITIECNNVEIDLNGFIIRQSEKFNLDQRFYTNICIGNSMFVSGQGPANFGTSQIFPDNVIVKNGHIGMSSHYGIFSIGCSNVRIENIIFEKFEVAGIHLAGGKNVLFKNIDLYGVCREIRVNSLFSQAHFILPFLESISNKKLIVNGKTVEQIIGNLKEAMEVVYNGGENFLTVLENGLSEGNVYGIVLTSRGVVVNDFKREMSGKGNENIYLENVNICDIVSAPEEKIAVHRELIKSNGAYGISAMIGPVGDILQYNLVKNSGNPYTDAQLCVAKFVKGSRTNIGEEFIEWGEGKRSFPGVLVNGGDTMGHFMKGNIGLFISSGYNIVLNNVRINGVDNRGLWGMESDTQYINEYLGNCSNGVVVSGCNKVRFNSVTIKNVRSATGNSVGINFIGDYSDIRGEFCKIGLLESGRVRGKKGIPNVEPMSYKFKYENGKKGVKIILD